MPSQSCEQAAFSHSGFQSYMGKSACCLTVSVAIPVHPVGGTSICSQVAHRVSHNQMIRGLNFQSVQETLS